MQIWKQIKRLWMMFVDVLGTVQTAIMLTIVYHLAVGPLSVFSRLGGRNVLGSMRPQLGGQGSYSVELKPLSSTLERAQRQF